MCKCTKENVKFKDRPKNIKICFLIKGSLKHRLCFEIEFFKITNPLNISLLLCYLKKLRKGLEISISINIHYVYMRMFKAAHKYVGLFAFNFLNIRIN